MPRYEERRTPKKGVAKTRFLMMSGLGIFAVAFVAIAFLDLFPAYYSNADTGTSTAKSLLGKVLPPPPPPKLDFADYDKRMLALAHINAASTTTIMPTASTTSTSTPKLIYITHLATTTSVYAPGKTWPAKHDVYPDYGALLPFNRIVAYYGNFYSTGMGVLGQYTPDVMIPKLQAAAAEWAAADPSTPVIPAIHYIVETAQGSAGADGKYRLRMPDDQIDKALALAAQVHGIVFLDFQVALSNLPTELPVYEKYLAMPNVHLAIDPEFSMKTGAKPGTVIGTMDATDVNFAANYLAKLVDEHDLPPKILVVHRFTQDMLTNYQDIKPLPEVQVVVDMDGWGSPEKKIGTYTNVVAPEPVQFTGFKLFYKNDLKPPSTRLLTPSEVLKLTPSPVYIQYQ